MKKRQYFYITAFFSILTSLFVVSFAAAATDIYAIDPVHTSATFKIKHLGVSYVHGRFNDVSGTLRYDHDSAANCSIEVQVKTESIDTTNSKRDDDLISPNFFDAPKFPFIRFKSTSVKKIAEDTFELTGNLTLHGVTRQVSVSAIKTGSGEDPWGGYRIGFETAFDIQRSDYEMKHMLGVVGNNVKLIVSIEAVRK